MDYDFSNADKDALMSSGVIARTILLDKMVGEYIKAHPNTTVVKQILAIIDGKFSKVTVYMEIITPLVVGKDVEKSIKASNAKFTWGAKSGKELESLVPSLKYQNDRSLVEVMEDIYPIYKVIGKIPFIRNLSNKISVLKKIS